MSIKLVGKGVKWQNISPHRAVDGWIAPPTYPGNSQSAITTPVRCTNLQSKNYIFQNEIIRFISHFTGTFSAHLQVWTPVSQRHTAVSISLGSRPASLPAETQIIELLWNRTWIQYIYGCMLVVIINFLWYITRWDYQLTIQYDSSVAKAAVPPLINFRPASSYSSTLSCERPVFKSLYVGCSQVATQISVNIQIMWVTHISITDKVIYASHVNIIKLII